MSTQALVFAILLAGGVAIVAGTVGYLYFGRIWFRAYSAGVPVTFGAMIGQARRGLSPYVMVSALVRAKEGGVDISIQELEAHYTAGEDIRRVVQTMVSSKREGRPLTFEEASAALAEKRLTVQTATRQEG